jgi:flagellar biosynthetic protein FliO
LMVILIIIIVSTAFIMSKFKGAEANNGFVPAKNNTSEQQLSENDKPIDPFLNKANDSVAMSLFKLVGALLLVVIGIYGFIYVLKRMMGQKLSGNRGHSLIEVIETSFIAQKKSVSLIRFADRSVLVGVSDGGINVLAELSPDETNRILKENIVEKPSLGFKGILRDAGVRLSGFNMRGTKGIKETVISGKNKSPQTA